ncbi:DUF4436 family protein [Streptomyces niveiscabiei]|uniref:DUF4436 family protein n=1 Tax=Streptomyces niveiscabiei TaxID=164115 RepID=UPI0006EB5C2B|nr:DUF4436 family protein [Streptomyces niveiscabiei]
MRLVPTDPHLRRSGLLAVFAFVLVLAVCASGFLLYLNERHARSRDVLVGEAGSVNRVDIQVTVQKVDAADQRATLRVAVAPSGSYGDPVTGVPARDLELTTSGLARDRLAFPAGRPTSAQEVSVVLSGGTISDYPFDRYSAEVFFSATVGGREVPVTLSVEEADPFFLLRPAEAEQFGGVVQAEVRFVRSRGSFILAWFMMVAMWLLGLAVASAAWIIVSRRRGLVWPALSWMAATLFALVGMRNAAPGSPPAGSLLDYASFFWVELLIAGGLCAVVVQGLILEMRERRADETPPAGG